MDRPKVFVTRVIPEVGLEKIRQVCELDLWEHPLPPGDAELAERMAPCDGALTLLTETISAQLMDACPQLKVLSNFAVGFNNIDIPAATSRGIRVGNTPGVLTNATADMAMTLMLTAARRVREADHWIAAGKWKTWEPVGHIGQDLEGRTLGIVGMGRIGFAVAKRCHGGWGMQVLYHDLHENNIAEAECGARKVGFDELLERSDFISIHAQLDETTKGLIDARALERMKKTAILINTARGPIVDSDALYEALRSHSIFAAGLDVTDPEPLPEQSPLLQLPNLVITPHIASATVTARNAMAEIAADNLIAGVSGEPLRCWVNPEVGSK